MYSEILGQRSSSVVLARGLFVVGSSPQSQRVSLYVSERVRLHRLVQEDYVEGMQRLEGGIGYTATVFKSCFHTRADTGTVTVLKSCCFFLPPDHRISSKVPNLRHFNSRGLEQALATGVLKLGLRPCLRVQA